jgi:hypothetical protein
MSRQLPSLPPLRDMVDMSPPRGTPSAPNSSWTAINHRPEGPVSPRTKPTSPQPSAHASPRSHQHHHDRTEPPTLPLDPTTATFSSIEPNYAGVSLDGHPARFSPGEDQTTGKPITARQDSAVFPSATAQTPTTILPGKAASRSRRSPDSHHRTARDTAIQPLTPPSDPSSHQLYHPASGPTYPPIHDRTQLLDSTRTHQEAADVNSQRRRERSHSDANKRIIPPFPHAALFSERNSMPPPPVPASTLPSDSLNPEVSSFRSRTFASQQIPMYSPDASNADEEASMVRCTFCHDTWSYPPPDTSRLVQQPSLTYRDMQQKMDALSTFTNDYLASQDAHYKRWRQRHMGGHCGCSDHQAGSKRKIDESAEDTTPPSKLQKLANEAPRTSHLTPPPDQANDEAASAPIHLQTNIAPPMPLDHSVARVIGPYIRPADDSNNMFYDAHGERQRVKTEETAQ